MSTHPYYNKATLAMEIAGKSIGTDVGIATAFTRDLIWVPRALNNTAAAVVPYKSRFCYQDTDRFSGTQTTALWSTSQIFPFTNVLILDGLLIEHFQVGSLFSRAKYLFEDTTYEYYAGFNLAYSTGSFKWVQVAYGIIRQAKSDGTMSNYHTVNLSYFTDNLPSGEITADSAIAFGNSLIANVRYFFITAHRGSSNTSLTITNNTKQMIIGLKYKDAYTWTVPNAFSFTLFDFDANVLIEDEGYVPAPEPTDDPYSGGGYSGSGGGPNPDGTGTTGTGGLHDDSSDAIPTPSLPTDATISSGLFTAYNPSASQLASFASALWNMQVSDINDVLRFLFGGDAFNAVIGLHLLPVAPSVGSSQSIKLGNWDTNVSAPKITSQYVQVPFGSLLLPEYWGNCIDYAPYTKIQLALPYIGIVDVDTDDVLGSTNTLTYNIDVLSGAICATLHCVKFNLSSVIYQWSGACAVSLPFSGASYNSVLSAIAGIAAAGMGFAAMAAGPIGAALPAAALAAGGGAFGAGSAASIMGTMKGKVQKSGSFGANSGALGIMTPYFILTRPVQSVPASWQADKGYPANISAQLGTLLGYTEVSEINLECSGTEAEKKEIIDLLKKGVLF